MHVLTLLAQEHWTGPAESVLQIAYGLQARGHRVTMVFTRLPQGHLAPHVDGGALSTLPAVLLPRKGFHPLVTLADWRILREYLRRERVDVISCHLSHDHWLATALRWGLAKPPVLVRQIHHSRHLARRADLAWLSRRTDAFVVAAAEWKTKLVQSYALDPAKVAVIPAGVDTVRFAPGAGADAIRAEVGALPGEPLIGMVARIKPGRGHDLALEAFARVRAQRPDARLLFVGRGEGKAALEAEVARRGLADRVHFLGYRSDDLPAIYRALDVHLLLGEGSDGSCRAALEAMASGVPVVALRLGTLTEQLMDSATGFFATASADDIAAKILSALALSGLRAAAREHALKNLSIARRVDLAEGLFRRLAEAR